MTVPMKDNPTVTVMTLVETGSKYETKDQNGLSHFLEHMCFKGTTKRPSSFVITSELDSLGAKSNAFTNTEYTGYYAKAAARYLPNILDVVSDVYLNSTFPDTEIKKEKGVVIEEINMYKDLPHNRVWEIFEELMYGDQPAGWPIIGNKKNVENISRADLLEYHRKHYVAEATLVVVAGNIDHKKVEKEVERAFADVKSSKKTGKKKTKDSQKSPQVQVEFKKTDQTHLVIGFRAFDTYSENNWALSVLSAVLGKGMSSRLFIKMREELGICYYIRSSVSASTDHGYFAVSAGVGHNRTQEAIEAIMVELRKIKKEGITEAELKKAKDFIIGNFSLDLESSDDFADFYGFQEVHHEKILNPDEFMAKIKKVTLNEVNSIAKEIFRKNHANLALVGPFKDNKPFLSLLEI